MKQFILPVLIVLFSCHSLSQSLFNYTLELIPVEINALPGLHSYAFAQHNGKWLIIGGRKDGMHSRQPFSSFPQSHNNTDIYVIDVNSKQFWSASVSSLPAGIRDQLQSTNMNFHQDQDTLYITGGYAFSASANNWITFPNLTTLIVPAVIDAVVNSYPLSPHFRQITDNVFAVTGGQLGKIGDTFYLVGGQRFDGRYNPFSGPSFTQTYTNQIRKFTVDNSGDQLSYSNYSAVTDTIHLRRRDYNLLPQIFPDGTEGYTISSGVFQKDVDLPFLYPVDITSEGYEPINSFEQLLSNYHCAKAALYDSAANAMHNLFFGGMSQFYYQNGILIQDDLVPFVKTISMVTRSSDGSLEEYALPVEMPSLRGAGAEFIHNEMLSHYPSGIIKLNDIQEDQFIAGYIYGGIWSPSLNPFANNQTNTTIADTIIYAVRLTKIVTSVNDSEVRSIMSANVFPNPSSTEFMLEYYADHNAEGDYIIVNILGQIVQQGKISAENSGRNIHIIKLDKNISSQILFLKLQIENKIFTTKQIIRR